MGTQALIVFVSLSLLITFLLGMIAGVALSKIILERRRKDAVKNVPQHRSTDADNIYKDWSKVGQDIRRVFNPPQH